MLLLPLGCGCGGSEVAETPGADLSRFPTARVLVGGVEFELWLATTPEQQGRGLMHATEEQLLPAIDGAPRGMLFVFPTEDVRSFWMRDTLVPLDLACAGADGTIVEVRELLPLDETPVVSGEPIRFAIEVLAGTLAARGIAPGAVIELP